MKDQKSNGSAQALPTTTAEQAAEKRRIVRAAAKEANELYGETPPVPEKWLDVFAYCYEEIAGALVTAQPQEAPVSPSGRPEHYKQLPKGVRCRCLKMWREADGSYWCCNPKSQPLGPTEPRQCLRCGTIDAFGSISKESQLATLIQTIEAEARRYAEMYPQSSDGRNTFVIFADWVAALALSRPQSGGANG